jgi:hypothetical protein
VAAFGNKKVDTEELISDNQKGSSYSHTPEQLPLALFRHTPRSPESSEDRSVWRGMRNITVKVMVAFSRQLAESRSSSELTTSYW